MISYGEEGEIMGRKKVLGDTHPTKEEVAEALKLCQGLPDLREELQKLERELEEMFYDFLQNISQKEYAAAIELMRQIAEDKDIRKAGEVIKYRKNRESESKNVIDNEGRLQVKRIFAVLTNRRLREKYFGF